MGAIACVVRAIALYGGDRFVWGRSFLVCREGSYYNFWEKQTIIIAAHLTHFLIKIVFVLVALAQILII